MIKKAHFLLIFLLIGLIGLASLVHTRSVRASASFQAVYQTPTPNADGLIIYTVQEGDNCTRIFLLTGVAIEQIIALNNLGEECSIVPSQELILATVPPATATLEGPQPTATPGAPTPTPFDGNGELCVVLFEDLDGNQMRSETETYLAGGVVSVSNRVGSYSETLETVGGDPELVEVLCFEDIPEGDYNISMGIPEGYNATTSLNLALSVSAGDTVFVDFGAQPGTELLEPEVTEVSSGRSPLMLVIGLFLLAGGAALAFFYIRSKVAS